MPDSLHPLALWLAAAAVGLGLGVWWFGWRSPSGWRGWLAVAVAAGVLGWSGCEVAEEAELVPLALVWSGFAAGLAAGFVALGLTPAAAQPAPQQAVSGEPAGSPAATVAPRAARPTPRPAARRLHWRLNWRHLRWWVAGTVSGGLLVWLLAGLWSWRERSPGEGASQSQPYENSLGMRFVPVPVGGGREVLFSIWETRRQDYEAYARANRGVDDSWRNASFEGQRVGHGDDHPVVMVSWEDAAAFCAWLTRKERAEGTIGPNDTYRLPSDHEWSCAAGIGEREDAARPPKEKDGKIQGVYPWGTHWPPPRGAGNFFGEETKAKHPSWQVLAGYNDGHVTTAPVGSFAANRLGLFDLGGNVWEWCADFQDGNSGPRVLRGGSWNFNGRGGMLSSFRGGVGPGVRFNGNGFRCVLELSARRGAAAAGAVMVPPPAPPEPVVPPAEEAPKSAASASKDQPFANSLNMRFVPVPVAAGEEVLFSVWETRRQDYAAYAEANSGVDDAWRNATFGGQRVGPAGDHPVVNVNWDDAVEFCAWLTRKERMEGTIGPHDTYRLPRDHEWSCAVGIGQREDAAHKPEEKDEKIKDVHPWGTQWPPPAGAGNYDSSLAVDEFDRTSPVGSFKANRYGLFDLGGNVWEWCEDLYDGWSGARIWRGGSWRNSEQRHLLASNRDRVLPANRNVNAGFRCVLVLSARGGAAGAGAVAPPQPAPPAEEAPKPAVAATKDQPFANSLGMRFVPVPVGGGKEVLFSIWETRRQDYEAFAKANRGMDDSWRTATFQGQRVGHGDDHPVVMVGWDDAVKFCAWLTKKERAEGKIPARAEYRLPTDAEWSWAVGIGEREDAGKTPKDKDGKIEGAYPWGAQWPPPPRVGNYADRAVKARFGLDAGMGGYEDGHATTAPVGSFAANRLGLFDLGGNVWEWCADFYDGKSGQRVLRGAGWGSGGHGGLLSSYRFLGVPEARADMAGFRCVLVVSGRGDTADADAVAPPQPASPAEEAPKPAVSATKDRPFENSLGMRFVPVPVGGKDVLFSIWETRRKDYEAYAKANSGVDGSWRNANLEGQRVGHGDDHPVVMVSWEDAKKFCEWLTEKERAGGKLPAGAEYRLPTDAEWSWAVGIGGRENATETPKEKDEKIQGVNPWGTQWPPPRGAGNYFGEETKAKLPGLQVIAGYNDGHVSTAPVGSFAANRFGLFDLGGNVWEWCDDFYDGKSGPRVLRGGSWSNDVRVSLLSSCRNFNDPGGRGTVGGFRCVLECGGSGGYQGAGGATAFIPVVFHGTWSHNKNGGQLGSDDSMLVIFANKIEGHEFGVDVVSVELISQNRIKVEAEGWGEGTPMKYATTFEVSKDGRELREIPGARPYYRIR